MCDNRVIRYSQRQNSYGTNVSNDEKHACAHVICKDLKKGSKHDYWRLIWT